MTSRNEQADPARGDGADGAPHPAVVAIGTSAGGLAALRQLFAHVPADSGMAYVIVIHLSPEHQSHLAELLQPSVKMPVQQVTETVHLERDRVYVIPPNANLESIDTHLRLSALEESRRQRAPIDHFFRTLALTHGGHAMGVILTGTGSDGTLGLRHIKEKGGLTIVQDPREAQYDGMPQSAIATGMVDLVLPLEQIPAALMRFARTQPRVPVPRDGEPVAEDAGLLLQKVFAQIRARTSRDFSGYKRSTILRRIARRMQLAQIEELSQYLQLLRDRPEETVALADDLLITVTSFFRDREVYEKLEMEVIPGLFDGKGAADEIRVWTPGCATGEEAYSLAMLLLEESGRREVPVPFHIFSTDLHEHSLTMAREGFYAGDIESVVSPERLKRFFTREDGGYRIRKEIREHVVFAHHNLLGDPPFSRLDLISCRNLLIYLERDVQRDVIEVFHYALHPEGVLVLGPSETVDAADLFHVEHKKESIYRKRNVPAPEPRLPVFPLARVRGLREVARPGHAAAPMNYGTLHERLVERYAPPSLLVSADDKVVHLSERVGRYLVHPGGEPTNSIYRLVREELRVELRSALHEVRERRTSRRTAPLPIRMDGETAYVWLEVHPADGIEEAGFALVTFHERSPQEVAPTGEGGAGGNSEAETVEAHDLKAERDRVRQRLQTLIEEYETTQEEMRASNEELQSTNEELRSTMEELETSKEELQSTNEELQTVNQENRHKVEELAQLSSDLQNLLAATDIATLFLDRELRILRFTPRVGELFHVRATDRGRPLSDLAHRLSDTELLRDAARVLDRLVPVEREVRDEQGNWYMARVLPYRSVEDRIEGVVITFVDITTRKRAEESLRELNETLEERVAERAQQVRQLAASLTIAEQEERRRISQLLHDDLQQLLYGIQMKLAHIREHPPAAIEQVLAQVARGMELLDDAIARTRQLTIDLSPPVLQSDGLVEALEWIQTQMRDLYDLDVSVRIAESLPDISRDMRLLLFQAVRELLFNVTKHSGTDRAEVLLESRDGMLAITVSDKGRGFDPDVLRRRDDDTIPGWGLFSVRERLRLQGGEVEISSRAGHGTRVVIYAPVAPSTRAVRRSGSER